MSSPFIGEIRLFGGNFAPRGWAFCNGAFLAISEYDALFNLIGTTYGGDGVDTFALPDLRGRMPIHQGQGASLTNRIIGEIGGVEAVTLTVNQLPIHGHPLLCKANAGDSRNPAGAYPALGATAATTLYADGPANATMNATLCQPSGGSQPHENRMPYLAINYIISLYGIYPTQS